MTLHILCYLFTSDSVFEDEGVETPPTAAEPAEEGDKPESNPNPAETEREEGEQQGTGQNLLCYFYFWLSPLLCLMFPLFLINVDTLVGDSVFPSWS